MENFIASFIVGIILIVIGISNTRGNISTLHKYHTKRVKPEDQLIFGKFIGAGSIIVGATLSILGILTFISSITVNAIFETIGLIIFIVGLVVGLGFCFYALFKYNKGIF